MVRETHAKQVPFSSLPPFPLRSFVDGDEVLEFRSFPSTYFGGCWKFRPLLLTEVACTFDGGVSGRPVVLIPIPSSFSYNCSKKLPLFIPNEIGLLLQNENQSNQVV